MFNLKYPQTHELILEINGFDAILNLKFNSGKVKLPL